MPVRMKVTYDIFQCSGIKKMFKQRPWEIISIFALLPHVRIFDVAYVVNLMA